MTIDPIRVMISSRCKDYVALDGSKFPLAHLRTSLQRDMNELRLFDEQLLKGTSNNDGFFVGSIAGAAGR